MKPTRGLLAPSANQIFVLKFRPASEKKTYKDTLKLRLNEVDKHTQVGGSNLRLKCSVLQLDLAW